MKKLVIIAVILSLLISPFAFATSISAATTISEPSFETVNYWTYSETDADWSGAQSTIWKTQGNSSYLFSTSGGNLGNVKYCQILQSVDFTASLSYYIELEEVPVNAATLMQIKLGTARRNVGGSMGHA